MPAVHPAVAEAADKLELSRVTRRRLLAGTGLVSASLAATGLLSACGDNETATDAVGNFPKTPNWKFVFINHVTTNPFFTPTQYGAEDACKLLGCSYQWTGSANSVVAEMVNATNTAISGKADGIAIAVVDKTAFKAPVDQALDAGIPVVSYNADGAREDPGTNRLTYVGQGLYESGYALGQRALTQVQSGEVVGFIATPGQLNIQPRIDGAQQAFKDAGGAITFTSVATNADITKGLSIIDAYAQGHPNLAGMLAVDAGSTQSIGQTVKKYDMRSKGLKVAGGFDLIPETLASIKDGDLDYTIDQQPYLQGFLPVLYLYLYKISGGLISPPQTNTGLLFVTKDNVAQYQNTQTRYEGSSTDVKLVERSGPIAHE
ncbi:sugar ABC transporter substrate-binding protein [Amorphoplanes digitatis]|uniref:Simple sugar transport system substrate-binding protein n=1 Tax=Actinoplanes digitatis TaxID=1868 RepID=A0A7W7MSH2_9ACTN|nr:sugar ABC transporter substrate-binding protein [Actinoplanes digitatis]MBB4764539.1 simple sugar transport system substrate-binding protein [Actinoplanes digitatis]BFE74015.1 sugar ABC transporter substrate-binding protein [Actinoplanes digitatis]GID91509.1 sugar ABC transporter substrate-binding protein [Actinoplanes digitatis]